MIDASTQDILIERQLKGKKMNSKSIVFIYSVEGQQLHRR